VLVVLVVAAAAAVVVVVRNQPISPLYLLHQPDLVQLGGAPTDLQGRSR
jgi:hypothetical protein